MTVRELTLTQAAQSFGGTLLYPDCRFNAVSIDTRTLSRGDLFIALRGARFDGHDFLPQAALNACGIVLQQPDKSIALPQWVVPDTLAALGQLASLSREQFSGPVIAITGSSGKTTVKEMVAAILSDCGPTLATRGNLNNHIGVPLTLLRLAAQHRYAVIEMGASAPGEIKYACDIARPTVALINNVMPAHVEGFGSLAGVARAKGEIYRGLGAEGTAVLNLDEPWLSEWRATLPCVNTLTFSVTDQQADLRVGDISFDNDGCAAFTLLTAFGDVPVKLGVSGRHNLANALAASACALAAGASLANISAGLEKVTPVQGRMEFRSGSNGARVIDDSYNANPGSVCAAIDTLAGFAGERVLVLGDMAELGEGAAQMHRDVGSYAQQKGIDRLLAVGPCGLHTVSGFGVGGTHFSDKAALIKALLLDLGADATVLVKGSRSAAMEEVVQALTTEENH